MNERKVAELDRQLKELQAERRQAIEDWIKAEHPLEIGSIVEVTGHAHRGKKMVVTRIGVRQIYQSWSDRNKPPEYTFTAKGDILKKDGSTGAYRGEWDQRHDQMTISKGEYI